MTGDTWIRRLEGLSDIPTTRALQIALAAIDEQLVAGNDAPGLVEAYEQVCRALADAAPNQED